MRVYHGSYLEIDKINLSKSKPRKDFGQAFYVTKFREQAEFWAKRIGEDHDTQGIVTEFEFDEFAYDEDELQVLRFEGYNEAWLDFVVQNRTARKNNCHSYDIVEGPIADDAVTQSIDNYLRGAISKTDFLTELTFHKETHQIAFCTVKSLQMLEKINSNNVFSMENIDNSIIETLVVNFQITEEKATDLYYSSKTYSQIANESTGLYEKPWEEIYQFLLQEIKLKK